MGLGPAASEPPAHQPAGTALEEGVPPIPEDN